MKKPIIKCLWFEDKLKNIKQSVNEIINRNRNEFNWNL